MVAVFSFVYWIRYYTIIEYKIASDSLTNYRRAIIKLPMKNSANLSFFCMQLLDVFDQLSNYSVGIICRKTQLVLFYDIIFFFWSTCSQFFFAYLVNNLPRFWCFFTTYVVLDILLVTWDISHLFVRIVAPTCEFHHLNNYQILFLFLLWQLLLFICHSVPCSLASASSSYEILWKKQYL